MHAYRSYGKAADADLAPEERYPSGLFLILSFLFHLTMFLLIQRLDLVSLPLKGMEDDFIELVDPEVLAPPRSRGGVLFGTDNLADLEAIPRGEETVLPPIPRSTGPAIPPAPEGSPGGAVSSPRSSRSEAPAPLPPAPLPSAPPPSTQAPAGEPFSGAQDGVSGPAPPGFPPIGEPGLSQPGLGEPGPPPLESSPPAEGRPGGPGGPGSGGSPGLSTDSLPLFRGGPGGGGGPNGSGTLTLPGGMSGLPFADATDLDRLAKVFSDRERPPKDAVSINTEDLKYFSYMLKIKNKIQYIWKYPSAAAARGIEGDLLLNFTIQRDGGVTDVAVISSSGYELLDREAVRAIHGAAPFAPLPDVWNQEQITITGHFLYFNRTNYIR